MVEVHSYISYIIMLGLSKVFQFLLLIFRNIWFIFEHILTFRLRTVVSDWSKSASRSRNLSMSSSSTSAPVRCLQNSQVNPYHNYILFKNLTDLPYKKSWKDCNFHMKTPTLFACEDRRWPASAVSKCFAFSGKFRNEKIWMLLERED